MTEDIHRTLCRFLNHFLRLSHRKIPRVLWDVGVEVVVAAAAAQAVVSTNVGRTIARPNAPDREAVEKSVAAVAVANANRVGVK